MTGGAGHILRVLPRLVLNRFRWHRSRYDRYEISFPPKQLSSKYFHEYWNKLHVLDKLQFTIVDAYLTFARAVCIFNANQYDSQCHRYLINICQALCNLISLYLLHLWTPYLIRNFNPSRLRGPTPHTLAYDSSFFPGHC